MKFKTILNSFNDVQVNPALALIMTLIWWNSLKTSNERIDGVHPSTRNGIFKFRSFRCMKVLDTILLSESWSEQVIGKTMLMYQQPTTDVTVNKM